MAASDALALSTSWGSEAGLPVSLVGAAGAGPSTRRVAGWGGGGGSSGTATSGAGGSGEGRGDFDGGLIGGGGLRRVSAGFGFARGHAGRGGQLGDLLGGGLALGGERGGRGGARFAEGGHELRGGGGGERGEQRAGVGAVDRGVVGRGARRSVGAFAVDCVATTSECVEGGWPLARRVGGHLSGVAGWGGIGMHRPVDGIIRRQRGLPFEALSDGSVVGRGWQQLRQRGRRVADLG